MLRCVLAAAVLTLSIAPAAARADTPLGVIPPPGTPAAAFHSAAALPSMSWHGGPVVRAHTVHTLYWFPPGYPLDPAYQAGVDGFFSNVQAALAAGAHANAYGVTEQYCGTDGADSTCDPAGPAPTFGGAFVDTNPYPAAAGLCSSAPGGCVTDVQIHNELVAVAQSQGWPDGLGTVIVVLTPPNVDVCTTSSMLCTYASGTAGFCGYHSDTTGTYHYLYLVTPDSGAIRCAPASLAPRGDVADTLDVVSHEHIETITDPHEDGWWAGTPTTGEIADNCRRTYGPAIAAAGGANQLINGTGYLLQQEQSNAAGGCIQGGSYQLAPHFTFTGYPAAGSPVTQVVNAGSSPHASIVSYRWDLGDGTNSSDPQAQHTYANPGTYDITLTITDAAGDIGTVTEALNIGPPRRGAGLRIASLSTPGGPGECRIARSGRGGTCTARKIKVHGRVGDSATAGESVKLALSGTVGGKHVTIHKRASLFNGAFTAAIAFPRSQHHSGEHWTIAVSYSGDLHLLAGSTTKGFRLEAG